jgi:4-methoxybenzoate monooxygenase (O-demethylating)
MDDDPFGHEILEDPTDFHRRLRDSSELVYLTRYGAYAMGRYEHVRAALGTGSRSSRRLVWG